MKWAEAVVKAVAEYKNYNYIEPGMSNTINDVYTVRSGDSLWSIAKKFNVSVDKLKQANNIKTNLIKVGQQLVIPGVAPPSQTNTTYVVQKGDTLYSIATTNNTTVDELVNLNDLINNNIYVGQILQIPDSNKLATDINTYTVKKGDTLYSISILFNTNPNAIISKNNLTSDILNEGQLLLIPSDVESTGNNEDANLGDNVYIVKKGDTLYSIAKNYNLAVDELKNINNLTSNVLSVGQVLNIPKLNTLNNNYSYNTYIVVRGDNLWSIAKKFNVSINDIRKINNLNSDILSIGQTLIIP